MEKVRREKIRDGEGQRWRKSEERMLVRKKVGKSRNAVFFLMFCGTEGSKSTRAKAAGAETSGQMRNEKLHAVFARSTFGSKKCQHTSA